MGIVVSLFGWLIFCWVLWFLFSEPKRSTQKRRRKPVVLPTVSKYPAHHPTAEQSRMVGPARYNFVHRGINHNSYYRRRNHLH